MSKYSKNIKVLIFWYSVRHYCDRILKYKSLIKIYQSNKNSRKIIFQSNQKTFSFSIEKSMQQKFTASLFLQLVFKTRQISSSQIPTVFSFVFFFFLYLRRKLLKFLENKFVLYSTVYIEHIVKNITGLLSYLGVNKKCKIRKIFSIITVVICYFKLWGIEKFCSLNWSACYFVISFVLHFEMKKL